MPDQISNLLDHLPEAAQTELAALDRLIKARELDEAEELLDNIEALPRYACDQLREAVRACRWIGAPHARAIDLAERGVAILSQIVSDQELRQIVGGTHSDTVVIVEGGQPRIITRVGAAGSAIHEGVHHLALWHGDFTMRQRMELLTEERRAEWKQMSAEEKIQTHLAKLEVEAAVQRRLRDQFAEDAEDDPVAALRMRDAEETLFVVGQQIDKVRGAVVLDEYGTVRAAPGGSLKSLGLEDAAPQMFSEGIHSSGT